MSTKMLPSGRVHYDGHVVVLPSGRVHYDGPGVDQVCVKQDSPPAPVQVGLFDLVGDAVHPGHGSTDHVYRQALGAVQTYRTEPPQVRIYSTGGRMAEWLGSRAINQKAVGSIPSRAKLRCVLGQGTSPYLPRGECPCTYCKSPWIRASAK